MSATNRGAERRENDYYPTPAWCVHRLLDAIGHRLPTVGWWLEPAVGDGAIVRAVQTHGGRKTLPWVGLDIAPRVYPNENLQVHRLDYLSLGPAVSKYRVGITNPPFSLALPFAQRMTQDCGAAIMLTRLNWLAGAKRSAWLREHTPSVYVLPDRPSFTGDGSTDATDYAWMVWGLETTPTIQILATTPKGERT